MMSFRAHHPRVALPQQLLCWLAILPLILSGGSVRALPARESADVIATDLRSTAGRLMTAFESDALLDSRDYEAQAIIDFVTRDVLFQAYAGVLRGVEGTLAGRAGNAHDQALTLAKMLRDAGYDAQILVGTLSAEQAGELLRSVASPPRMPIGADSLKAPSLERSIELARRYGQNSEGLLAEADGYAMALSESLAGRLDEGELIGRGLRDSTPYRWVRYREGASDPWIEVHPAYPKARAWQLEFERVEADQVDPADLQSVEVEVWIENSDNERRSVTGVWQAPAASLMGRPLSIELLSDAALQFSPEDGIEALIARSEFFFVQLNGALPAEGRLFDLYGDVLSGTAMDGLNSIFSSANRRVRQAIDALGGGVERPPGDDGLSRRQLTRVWVEFRLVAPNGRTDRIERVLFDGRALEERPQAAARLIQRWDLDVVGVTPLPEYYQARGAMNFAAALEGYVRLQRYLEAPGVPSAAEFTRRSAEWMGGPAPSRLLYVRQMFDRFEAPASVVTYPNRPNLLALRQGLTFEEGRWVAYEMTDIVSNHRVSFRRQGGSLQAAFDTTIARGVWETRAESFRPGVAERVARTSAYDVLTRVPAADLDPEEGSNDLRLAASGTDAWWQLDPTSGSIIGMQQTAIGSGGQATDYLTALTVGVSAVFFAVGTGSCVQATNDVECCFLTNLSISVVGFALGFSAGLVGVALLGSSAGTAVGAGVSVLADLGLQNAPTFCS